VPRDNPARVNELNARPSARAHAETFLGLGVHQDDECIHLPTFNAVKVKVVV
jgi:hypothetical protein